MPHLLLKHLFYLHELHKHTGKLIFESTKYQSIVLYFLGKMFLVLSNARLVMGPAEKSSIAGSQYVKR